MSRRSQWESMRQEARSRVEDLESALALEHTPNNDSSLAAPSGSGERLHVEPPPFGLPRGTEKINYEDATRRSHGVENAAVPIVSLIDVPASPSVKQHGTVNPGSAANRGSPLFPESKAGKYATTAGVSNNNNNNNNNNLSAEETLRELSTVGSEDVFMLLQVELAQEKEKNIAAVQQLVSLDKEIKSLREENMRLVSAAASNYGVNSVRFVGNTGKQFAAGDGVLGSVGNRDGGASLHMEQMLQELQEELGITKEYTKELELRLAEKTNALERCSRELEQKEIRVRQLERTIADELIRRTKAGSADASSMPTASHVPATTTPAATTGISVPSNTNNNNNNNNAHKIISASIGDGQGARGKAVREKTPANTIVPSTVQHPTASALRLRHEQERSSARMASEPLAHKNLAVFLEASPSSHTPATRDKLWERAASVFEPQPRTNGHALKESTGNVHEHIQSGSILQHEHSQRHSRTTATDNNNNNNNSTSATTTTKAGSSIRMTPRRASFTGRRSTVSDATPSAMKGRRKDSADSAVPLSSRPSSIMQKKLPASKTPGTERRRTSTSKRDRKSPIPHPRANSNPSPLNESVPPNASAAHSSTSRRSVARPPPLETSVISVSGVSASTSTLQHLDTRSVASTARSRPRIHRDGAAAGVVQQASASTVVTRSAKRRESPFFLSQPRLDSAENVQGDQALGTELFSTMTYRPSRLLPCSKSEREQQSATPPPL